MKHIDRAIEVLNEAIALDPDAIRELFNFHVLVNDELRDHPTIQVGRFNGPDNGPVALRVLGLINGILGVDSDGWGYVAAEVDEAGRIQRFRRTPSR